MRAFPASLAMLLVANSVLCLDADPKPANEDVLRSYMSGEYDLIGRKADSTATDDGT